MRFFFQQAATAPGTLYPHLEPQSFENRSAAADAQTPIATEPSQTARTIASTLITGAEYIASGLNIGTKFTEELVHKGGAHYVNREDRVETKPVDPKVISTLRTVRYGAETASTVSTTVVSAVAAGTRSLSEKLVPHIQRHGSKLVSDVTGRDQQSSAQTMNDIISVTAGGLQGFGTIYNSVTANAKTLAKAVSCTN